MTMEVGPWASRFSRSNPPPSFSAQPPRIVAKRYQSQTLMHRRCRIQVLVPPVLFVSRNSRRMPASV